MEGSFWTVVMSEVDDILNDPKTESGRNITELSFFDLTKGISYAIMNVVRE